MKKLMLLSCLILCFGKTHALLLPVPTYELPEGMTEHDFAVSYITGKESAGKDGLDMSQEEQLLTHSKDKKFRSLGNDVKLSAYSEVLFANTDKPESVKAIVSALARLDGLGNDALLSVYTKVLATNPEYTQHIVSTFCARDSDNLASYGEPEMLRLVRESISRDEDIPLGTLMYLAFKGDKDEIMLIEKAKVSGIEMEGYRKEMVDVLRERVEQNFIIRKPHFIMYSERGIRPSVANTGPQGVYAYHILWKACEKENQLPPNIPEELVKMVITFDEDGNPVSNVDLAKYGLSMPVITPKPDKHYRGTYTVTFPHETEATVPTPPQATEPTPTIESEATPPTDTTQAPPPPEQPQATPKNKNPLWLGILTLAVISAVTVWSLAKQKR